MKGERDNGRKEKIQEPPQRCWEKGGALSSIHFDQRQSTIVPPGLSGSNCLTSRQVDLQTL